ncbi:related to DNA polymerase epsilon subunit B [Saccharomycodes ludwigii]|uniref:DNA polymerase epsilon subunit B n=1 Tax=Saccharomycodes ludwigii TaxID=36035 RepID=A0A376B6Z3_9ASCO|nr:hypothetical protein SCDLUD_000028 [Saccharomycodes ludwigii]KAH3902451.1 hypothetical protein SCDLUD_000028 [Saccharomycodes ludwigii]SSD60477.1 related to DNA polymerase epsilon subunit B [Saccharomycodes ludwigii]
MSTVLPVDIPPSILRPIAYRILSKKYGLNIKSDGLKELTKYIGKCFGIGWKKDPKLMAFLESFALFWKEQDRGLFITSEGVIQTLKELKEREQLRNANTTASATTNREKDTLSGKKNSIVKLDSFLTKKKAAIMNNTYSDTTDSDIELEETDNEPNLTNHINNNPENINFVDSIQWEDYFKIVTCFNQQNFQYNSIKKNYVLKINGSGLNNNRIPSKIIPTFQNTRYLLIKDRLLRREEFNNEDQEFFNPLSSLRHLQNDLENNALMSTGNIQITQIKNLLGRNGENFLLLGLLRISERGSWCLEDPSGSVCIDLSQTIPLSDTYFFQGCIVLAEGIYYSVGDKFYLTSICSPEAELREKTLDSIGQLDLLGVHSMSTETYYSRFDNELRAKLLTLESSLVNNRIFVLGGNLYLDDLLTFEALKKVFKKIDMDPPTLLILQGSFTSVPIHPSLTSSSSSLSKEYQNGFEYLAILLSEFENLINYTHFIFVPGCNDPWSSMSSLGTTSNSLPQANIPKFFTTHIQRMVKHCDFVTNPARIAYLSSEIVIFRDDINSRMKRYNITFQNRKSITNNEDNDLELEINRLVPNDNQVPIKIREARKIVKTVLDQSHLSPFMTSLRPINWELDHTLQLNPLPTILLLTDTTAPTFEVTYNKCKTINTGTFITQRRKANYIDLNLSSKNCTFEEINF